MTYHIIWTTYGTWLPGDRRGWVQKKKPGIQDPDPKREEGARITMAESAIVLNAVQRSIVDETIHTHCEIRDWSLHALNVRSNHVHVVLTADRAADDVVRQLKAWCSRNLSDDAGLETQVAAKAGRRRWFTEGGEAKVIDSEEYLENAIHYVMELQ
ncbi:MAG: transposase [Pirellulaceae bacterium]